MWESPLIGISGAVFAVFFIVILDDILTRMRNRNKPDKPDDKDDPQRRY